MCKERGAAAPESHAGERLMKKPLTIKLLLNEARVLAQRESDHKEPSLYGVTDGKAVGTYFEHKFQGVLQEKYAFEEGSSAKGIDFPNLEVDMKVTSIKQPQSSCPFKSARQKIYGIGYSLLVFVYEKLDDPATSTGTLRILHTVFIEKHRTADFQTTSTIRQTIENGGNADDLVAFMFDRNLPVDEVQAHKLAKEMLDNPPLQGYLTISNALQWRLQYRRVIDQAGDIEGILRL